MASDLANIVKKDIDLVDLRKITLDVQFVIIGQGQRIYCNDLFLCDSFEMTTFSMYQRFEEEQKPIIDAIKERKKFYA